MKAEATVIDGFILIVVQGTTKLVVPIEGPRSSPLANLVLLLPLLIRQLAQAGVRELFLADEEGREGRFLPSLAWALWIPKGDPALEGARLEALDLASKSGIAITSNVVIHRLSDRSDLGAALRAAAGKPEQQRQEQRRPRQKAADPFA